MDRLAVVNKIVNELTGAEFAYGELDCCLFAARVYEEITGEAVHESFSYGNEEEAYELIEEYGSLEELVGSLLGEPSKGLPRPGDIVLLDLPAGETLGAWYMRGPIVKSPKRFVEAPASRVRCFWSAG